MIFIGGIHGVGKTSLSKELTLRYKIPHFSASKLISDEKEETYSRNKLIPDIEQNQDLLSTSINRLNISDWFLLDGHFCLLNQKSKITRIPFDTFKNISPNSIIVLTDSISSIQERFSLRDNYQFTPHLLESFQNKEVEYAKEISNALQIPILIVQAGDIKTIHHFIERVIDE
ncbi:ATP-binding protein [Paenibacillus thiaminolyticus]|uniref:ATP-binding protein n=1 Tax=Paenibacillus thiaminolyticus TaxID=49283 RepID=UPI002543278E|nr:ATP-binding protein [Paenibacillus thiaminolyticus]WII40560.1 ATP-binding protein [Paenibacillus thiaminolyticus]